MELEMVPDLRIRGVDRMNQPLCDRDCPERKGGCHAHCEKYHKKRKALDEKIAKERLANCADGYVFGQVAKNKRYFAPSLRRRP